ncbi:Acyl-CoA reductase [Pseudonocardia thermophila]|jgi:NAD-dependent aldehyde dehydrogenases|uniref:Acyl-CoA reductase n=1 Tax=Pseudonocardia thermophila TaxID=1848 RepID=A0A1M6PNC0_PSETH|nr:aldehyde dehydrogenase family protein [Pseudonocardia thermophila]SHK09417.1 Acyl-CoA reductase [Pseudonocardia thermophila]
MTISTAARRRDHHIDGEPVVSATYLVRENPATGEPVAEFAAGSAHEVDLAVTAARRAFDHGPWPRMPAGERAAVLRRFAAAVEAELPALAALDREEAGRPIRFARADVRSAAAHIATAAALIETQCGESWTDVDRDLVAYSVHEPAGVAGLIIPWNFPAGILCQKLPYALAVGCTVVVKPSEFTSSSALEIARLAEEAGVPPGVVNVVTGLGSQVGAPLSAHRDVDVVSFTGSTASGRAVASAAGASLTRAGLELGGKGAVVVLDDADLDQAVEAAVFAAFFNSGQCCVAGPRILVHAAVADRFREAFLAQADRLVTGDPADERTDLGPLIHEDHLRKVLGHVDAGRAAGARVLRGGARSGGELARGAFLPPTILDGLTPESPVFHQEIFGPVVSLTEITGVEEAVRLANATSYGLAHTVWTSDVSTAHAVARELRSGTVWVNTHLDGSTHIPFGGVKASGFGREAGRAGLLEFTSLKTVQIRSARRAYGFGTR